MLNRLVEIEVTEETLDDLDLGYERTMTGFVIDDAPIYLTIQEEEEVGGEIWTIEKAHIKKITFL